MKFIGIISVIILLQSCSLNQLMGGYNTTVTEKTTLKPTEGLVVASIKNKYQTHIFPNFLIMKDGECQGFSSFGESPILVGDEINTTYINVKKMPEGRYFNLNWSLYYNGPPTWGVYRTPEPNYIITFSVKAGEITYLGEISAVKGGVDIADFEDRDMDYIKRTYDSSKNLKVTSELIEVKEYTPLGPCN